MAVSRESPEYAQGAMAFIERVELLARLDDVTSAMEQALAPFGIESFIVTALPTKEQPFEGLVMASRWPAEFFARYVEDHYAQCDPLSRRGMRSHMPFEWDAESYQTHADPRVVEMMFRAAASGLRHGYFVPIHGPGGEEGCVSMAAASLDLSDVSKASLHLIALYAFDRMRRLRGPLLGKRIQLTPREREVLTWAARGKSASEIGRALHISKRTVDEHTQTATRKLGAANRTQAVVIALRDRIIDP
ncbi:MAG TPA: LuxR family transcriptional regulator [Xanthobacteraceae bacterium]|jgi:LuxR family quorum sensing-dependent transcriptional regulator